MAVRPGQLKTVEDCAAWIYEHDGRIDAWWEAQRDHNARASATVSKCQSVMRVKIDKIDEKIDDMQKTIYKAVGFATAAGGVIGVGVTIATAMLNGH
jgi:hypothetical protein